MRATSHRSLQGSLAGQPRPCVKLGLGHSACLAMTTLLAHQEREPESAKLGFRGGRKAEARVRFAAKVAVRGRVTLILASQFGGLETDDA